jgi:hypothetical protein
MDAVRVVKPLVLVELRLDELVGAPLPDTASTVAVAALLREAVEDAVGDAEPDFSPVAEALLEAHALAEMDAVFVSRVAEAEAEAAPVRLAEAHEECDAGTVDEALPLTEGVVDFDTVATDVREGEGAPEGDKVAEVQPLGVSDGLGVKLLLRVAPEEVDEGVALNAGVPLSVGGVE